MSLRCNIEFKARLVDFDRAVAIARRCADIHLGAERQIDTYFVAARGRLKLREIEGRGAWLIGYERSNDDGTRGSDYRLVEIADPANLRATLSTALGVLVTVRKVREIYLDRNVRIHLDRVEGLGEFLEFEAVLTGAHEDVEGRRRVDALRDAFAAVLGEPIATSYSDLLLSNS